MKSIALRRKEANQRLELRGKRSPKAQLALIASRPGASTSESARLNAQLTAPKQIKSK